MFERTPSPLLHASLATDGSANVRRPASFTSGSMILTGGLGAAQVISAITFVLAARFLGPSAYGHVAALYGVALFSATILDFGAATQGMRTLARTGESSEFQRLAPARASLTAVFIALSVGALTLGVSPVISLLPLVAAAIAFEQFACAPSRARERFAWVSVVLMSDKVSALILFCSIRAFDLLDGDLALMIALASGPMVGTVLAIRDWDHPCATLFKIPRASPWRGSGHLGVGGLAIGLQSLDIQLMGWSAGPAVAGAYAAVSKWGAPITLLASGVSQASFPAMTTASGSREAEATLRRAQKALLAPIVLLGIMVAIAGDLVPRVLGDAYTSSVPTFRIFAIAIIFVCVSQPLVTFLQARGQERRVGGIMAFGTAIQLGAVLLLARPLGPLGGAVAAATAQLAICLFIWRSVRSFILREALVHSDAK